MSALPSIAPQLERQPEADAAADLYARHSARIFGYCLGLLRNREEAEDAVQTTFLNAYRGLRRGIEPEFEAAWLFKIAQNVCRTRRESSWRRGRVETVRGNESTFAQLYLRPRDMLKFGILYLARRPTCHICSEFVATRLR